VQIVLTPQAQRQMDRLNPPVREKIVAKVRLYAGHPASLANQVKRLKGSGYLRLRVGDYRVIFTEDGVILTIIKVGHRRDVYD
jgi:mRNA interferase RelE/StbE